MIPLGNRKSGLVRGFAWMLGGLVMLIGSGSHALYTEGDRWPASADAITRIPVCFQTSGDYTPQADAVLSKLVREAIAATWGRWFNLEFSGFGDCQTPPANQTLTIKLARFVLDTDPDSKCVTKRESIGGAGDIPDQCHHHHRGYPGADTPLYGWLQINDVPDDRHAWAVVVHEVGHALSFEHEQSRPDAVGFCSAGNVVLTGTIITKEYDDVSTMNYCVPYDFGRLSWLDIKGAQTIYGVSPAG